MERGVVSGGYVADDEVAWKMGRILLRYRPIAPKPLAAGASPGGVVRSVPCGGREKRRGVARRQGGCTGGRRGRKSKKVEVHTGSDDAGLWGRETVVTLPLIPETPERKEAARELGSPVWSCAATSPWFYQAWEKSVGSVPPVAGVVVAPRPVRVVAASVTVESVTERWAVDLLGVDGDEVLRRWLDSDDSPAFVSDTGDRVIWINAAFRNMVVGGGTSSESLSSSSSSSSSSYSSSSSSGDVSITESLAAKEVRVALATRGLVASSTCRAFTCTARVRYASRMRGKVSLASPCDVWRMEDGSLAWRLDVKAALSLSISA